MPSNNPQSSYLISFAAIALLGGLFYWQHQLNNAATAITDPAVQGEPSTAVALHTNEQSTNAARNSSAQTALDKTQPPEMPVCQHSASAEFVAQQQPLLAALRAHLLQQLENGDNYYQLSRMLPDAASRKALNEASKLLAAKRAPEPITMQEASAEIAQLTDLAERFADLPDDASRRQAIHSVKSSSLFRRSVLNQQGTLSAYSSRGLLLSMLSEQPALMDEVLADVRLQPADYQFAFISISKDELQTLLKHSDGLQSYRFNGLNLADMAVMFLRADLLPLLGEYQLQPTDQPGHFSALDLAFVTPEWPSRTKQGASLASPSLRREATIKYLQQRGYSLHAHLAKDSLGKNSLLVQSDWFVDSTDVDSTQAKRLYQANLLALADDYPKTTVQAQPATAELQALLAPLQQLQWQFDTKQSDCQFAIDAHRQQQGLWTTQQIKQQLAAFLHSHQTPADLALLQQLDPALLSYLWQPLDILTLTRLSSAQLAAQLATAHAQAAKQDLNISEHQLNKNNALLANLLQNPTLAPDWPALQLSSLHGLFAGDQTLSRWQTLVAQGFDIHLQDRFGRNLYPQAFAAGPKAVNWLLAQQVAVNTPQLGPDALDLALDQSYQRQQLYPALPAILAQARELKPSHLRRIKRLAVYQPDLFNDLQAQWQSKKDWPAWPDLSVIDPSIALCPLPGAASL